MIELYEDLEKRLREGAGQGPEMESEEDRYDWSNEEELMLEAAGALGVLRGHIHILSVESDRLNRLLSEKRREFDFQMKRMDQIIESAVETDKQFKKLQAVAFKPELQSKLVHLAREQLLGMTGNELKSLIEKVFSSPDPSPNPNPGE